MTCNFSRSGVGASMTGIVIIPSGSESSLQAAVASAGPVAAAVDASTNGFRVGINKSYRLTRTCIYYNTAFFSILYIAHIVVLLQWCVQFIKVLQPQRQPCSARNWLWVI